MPECFMSKHSGQNGVQNHGVLSASHLGSGKKGSGTPRHLPGSLVQPFHGGKLTTAAQT